MDKFLRKYIVLTVLSIIISLTSFLSVGSAEEQSNPTGFLYDIQFPDNQKTEAGYFDLKMSPGQQQTVHIILKNASEKEILVGVDLNGTKTNSKGVLEYGPVKIEKDPSLKYDFADIVKAPDKVTLAPNSEQPLDISITMPEISYDGIVVGGIQLKQIDEKQDETQKHTSIINKYAYVVAMVLQETDTVVQPDLKFNKIYASQINYQNTIITDLSNVEASFLDDLSLEVQITGNKSEEVLYETKKSGMRVAPNSNISFPISMQGEKMIAGKYKANISAVAGDKKWSWNKEFEITKEEADKFNRADLGLIQNKGIKWPLIIGIAVGLFLLIIAVFFVIRTLRGSKNKRSKEKKSKKK